MGPEKAKERIQVDRIWGATVLLESFFRADMEHNCPVAVHIICLHPKAFWHEEGKDCSHPMDVNIKKLQLEPVPSRAQHKEGTEFPYRSLIESSLYICTSTRPHMTSLGAKAPQLYISKNKRQKTHHFMDWALVFSSLVDSFSLIFIVLRTLSSICCCVNWPFGPWDPS